jgi:hypothetical protein
VLAGEPSPISLQFVALLSAAVGAAISSLAIILNGAFERRARLREAGLEHQARERESAREREANRKQVLMEEAGKLADWRLETLKRNSELTGIPVLLPEAVVVMEKYYEWLTHLWEHGKLPSDPQIKR